MTMRILRAEDRTPTRWKNGGGVASEIAAWPEGADLDAFDWRVSVAMVEQGGPFSAFPGVDRLMLVMEGRLELEIAGAGTIVLDETSAAAEFPGDAAVAARAPAEPVTDINVMVRRGRYTASLERRRIVGAAAVVCQDVTLVMAPQCVLAASLGARRGQLAPGDALRLDGPRGALVRLRAQGAAELIIVHVNAER